MGNSKKDKKRDDVLKRMLNTPPETHKPKGKSQIKRNPPNRRVFVTKGKMIIDEAYIHGLITDRINKFHNALVDRGHIPAITPQSITEESAISCCTEGHATRLDQTQSLAVSDC